MGGMIFRFEPFCLSHEYCKNVISHAQASNPWDEIWSKTTNCTEDKVWSQHRFGHIKKAIRETEKRLKLAQRLPPSDYFLKKCKELRTKLDDLHIKEDSSWHIRSRVNELKDGDQNTDISITKQNHIEEEIP